MKISPARIAAFDVLRKIESENAFSSVLLPQHSESLSVRDRALCYEIVLGVLRRRNYLDRITDLFTVAKQLDTAVRIALRIGLYQLKFLERVPDYSAISESVELVNRAKKTSAKGLVNAVLRRASREQVELEFADEIEQVSVETSHPRWLVERWIREFGLNEAYGLCRANNEVPATAFRRTARSLTGNFDENDFGPSKWVDGCLLTDRAGPELLEAAERGEIYFQDEASQLVGAAVRLRTKGRFLDVCASPGSKTTQIAVEGGGTGTIVAGDLHWPRVEFLKQNCARQGVGFVNVVQYDAGQDLPFERGSCDNVLVDAPCSGTGTIRHNPEIRYFLKPEDFDKLSCKQLSILKNASEVVKSGGELIYSTCSLEREENEAVCERFLSEISGFDQIKPEVPERFLTSENFARTFPPGDAMDGFFIAAFRRAA